LFKDFFDEKSDAHFQKRADTFLKKIDETFEQVTIKDTDQTFVVKIKLPGYKKQHIKITIDTKNNMLKISAKQQKKKEKRHEQKNQDVHVYIHKKQEEVQNFYKTISIPKNLNLETIKTEYKDDLLTITFEKIQEKTKQKIRVELK
jgi:HSP20 family protein